MAHDIPIICQATVKENPVKHREKMRKCLWKFSSIMVNSKFTCISFILLSVCEILTSTFIECTDGDSNL